MGRKKRRKQDHYKKSHVNIALVPESFATDIFHEEMDANGVLAENADADMEYMFSLEMFEDFAWVMVKHVDSENVPASMRPAQNLHPGFRAVDHRAGERYVL